MLLILVLGLLVIVSIQFWYKQRKRNKQIKGFASPPGLPLFRHFFVLTSKSGLLPGLLSALNRYGGFLKLEPFYGFPFLIVTDKDFIFHILSAKPILTKDAMYTMMKEWIGDGIICADPIKWKKQRKIANPAFNSQMLENYVKLLELPSNILVKKLKREVANDGFDVSSYISLWGFEIMCETFMAVKLNAQATDDLGFINDVDVGLDIIASRLFSPIRWFEPTYMLCRDYWIERNAIRRIRNFIQKVINGRREAQTHIATDDEEKRNRCILDILLSEQFDDKLTDKQIVDEVLNFVVAGVETSVATINFCLYCLSKHSEVQIKAVEELESIFGNDLRSPTTKDLNEMQYLDMVIKETLRLYPPAPLISRLAEEDISYGDVFIPKGISIGIFLYGLHRNPEYHRDPEKFDPNRFESDVAPLTFLPFSCGPRNCIGQRFAMLEIKYVLCQVLRSFRILPVYRHIPEEVILLTLRFQNGVMIRLQPK